MSRLISLAILSFFSAGIVYGQSEVTSFFVGGGVGLSSEHSPKTRTVGGDANVKLHGVYIPFDSDEGYREWELISKIDANAKFNTVSHNFKNGEASTMVGGDIDGFLGYWTAKNNQNCGFYLGINPSIEGETGIDYNSNERVKGVLHSGVLCHINRQFFMSLTPVTGPSYRSSIQGIQGYDSSIVAGLVSEFHYINNDREILRSWHTKLSAVQNIKNFSFYDSNGIAEITLANMVELSKNIALTADFKWDHVPSSVEENNLRFVDTGNNNQLSHRGSIFYHYGAGAGNVIQLNTGILFKF